MWPTISLRVADDPLEAAQAVFDPEFLLLRAHAQTNSIRPGPEREPESISILEIINKPRQCIVLGEPGAGKTTTLRRLALHAARERLRSGSDAPLPLLIQLPFWLTEPEPLDFVQAHWPFEADVGSALATGDVILLLDGLSEMGGRGVAEAQLIRTWISSPHGQQRVVVTCRSHDYGYLLDLGIDEIRVKPMDEETYTALRCNLSSGTCPGVS